MNDDLTGTLDSLGIAPSGGNGGGRVDETSKTARETGVSSTTTPMIPWKPFPTDALPEPVAGLVRAGSVALGCDPSFIALPLLAGLASAVGATRRIQLKRGWCEPAVVWSAIVGESGTLKSPAVSVALASLKRLQAFAMAEYPELQAQYERDKALYEADSLAWKRKGRAKGEPPPEKPQEPVVRRYLVDDITVEALADRLQAAPRGLLCGCDELAGWLSGFDQYKSVRGADVSRWLSIHRAGNLLVDRKTGAIKTIFIPRAAVSVTGGIQPETLSRALGTEHLANGLAARLLLAMPPRSAKTWTDATVDLALMRHVERVFGRLLALDFVLDQDDQPAPVDIPLSSDGKAAWVAFYNSHAQVQAGLTGDLASAASKLEGYCARLSLIVHLVRTAADDPAADQNSIDATSIAAGATMVEWFGDEARRVYQTFHESEEARDQRQLVELIERHGNEITARDLRRSVRRFRDSTEEAERALTELAEAGFGEWVTTEPTEDGGRPTAVFRLAVPSTVDETPPDPERNRGFVDRHGDVDEINAMFGGAADADAEGH